MSNLLIRPILKANSFTAETIRFVPYFQSLVLVWQRNHPKSAGVDDFIERFLPAIRRNNPLVKYVLNYTYVDCDPFVVGEYNWNRFRRRRLCFKTSNQILAAVEEMSIGGDFRPGKRRGVAVRVPRGMEIWDTETKGHDVFKVLSKWKGDPIDPLTPTWKTRPPPTDYLRIDTDHD